MATKTFAIRLPEIIRGQPEALLTWINSHINPGVPIAKTTIEVKAFVGIYDKFQLRLNRCLSLDTINAYRAVKKLPLMSGQEHAGWLTSQDVELNISQITEGRFQAKFQLMGPAHSPSVDGQLHLGYEDLCDFEIGLYYNAETDIYHMAYKDTRLGEVVPVISEPLRAVKLFPVFEFNYETNRKEPDAGLSTMGVFALIKSAFAKAMWDDRIQAANIAELAPPAGYYGYEHIDNAMAVLENQMLFADAFAGNFFKPLLLQVFTIEIPVKEGRLFHTRATFSFGQRASVMLTPLLLKENPAENMYVYN